MKKIALMLMVAIAAIACNKTEDIVPEIKVTTTDFTLPLAGTEDMSFKIQFNTNVAWTAALKEVSEWCTITPASGVAGDASVTVIALENPTEEERTATVVITAGSAVEEVVLTQEAVFVPRLSVSPAEGVALPLAGGSATLEVTANVDYTVTVAEDATWLSYTQDGNVLTFTAAANEDFAGRVAGVTFATAHEGVGTTVNVSQEGRATKLWTKHISDFEGYDAGLAVRLVKYGDFIGVANTTKVYVLNPATGNIEMTINMPEGFYAHSVLVDDAGNFLIASDAGTSTDLTLFHVPDPFNPAPEVVFNYNTGNYYAGITGNIRVRGNIKDDALITATASDGAGGACLYWEVVDGVCGDWHWINPPYTTWTTAQLCTAPAGTSIADGLFYIGYGGDYNLRYVKDITPNSGSHEWGVSYVTGASWMENFNSISTTEWNGHKYAAICMSCHFNYDDADAVLLNVDDPAAAQHVYTYSGTPDVERAEDWTNLNWTGLGTYSDILIYPTEDALMMLYIDGNYGAMSCVAVK